MTGEYIEITLGELPATGLRTNGCIYPREVLEKALQKQGGKMIVPRHLQQMLEHPQPVACSIRPHDMSKKPAGLYDGLDASEFMSEVEMEGTLTVQVMSGSTLISWDLCQVIEHEG